MLGDSHVFRGGRRSGQTNRIAPGDLRLLVTDGMRTHIRSSRMSRAVVLCHVAFVHPIDGGRSAAASRAVTSGTKNPKIAGSFTR